MEFRSVERAQGAFQQSVTAAEVDTACRRALGADAVPVSAIELGTGMYNSVYRVTMAGRPQPVILRVAPREADQFGSERHLMRNEFAAVPWLTVIAPLMPRVIAADWSHEVVDRDWMLQTHLDGVPAPEALGRYPRTSWPVMFRRLGEITAAVQGVRGPWFGRVTGPGHSTWSRAVIASLEEIAADLELVGLDASDVRAAAVAAREASAVLDEVTEPRLLTGDLWTVNCLLDAHADVPTITGVVDFDRCEFGDPAADWAVRMASAKSDERAAFWDAYGEADASPKARWRFRLYQARHLGAIRLERHRLGKTDAVKESYGAMAEVLAELG
ncbi:hypothetical protein GCM10022254_39240 [Actinomadura meridiana]|uniref:Aminoglycoside phosphotransferase domain-containing protein n=2 Tax=Actinomadura meridiana TaxID=559626 RepID=A0ABP8C657_9ACTN